MIALHTGCSISELCDLWRKDVRMPGLIRFAVILSLFLVGCSRQKEVVPSSERLPLVFNRVDSLCLSGSRVFIKLSATSPVPESLCNVKIDVERIESDTIITFAYRYEVEVPDSLRSHLGHYEVTPIVSNDFPGWKDKRVRFRFWQGSTAFLDTVVYLTEAPPAPPKVRNDPVATANRDSLFRDLAKLSGCAQLYFKQPSAQGGGGGSFLGLTIQRLVNDAKPSGYENSAGRYTLEDISATSLTIVATGKRTGNDGVNPVKVIMHVAPDAAHAEPKN